MITPEQFQEIGETLLPLLDDLTEWIARDMIERFMIRFGRGEKKLLTGTDEWQAWVLEQAGGNLDEIQKALAKSTGKSQQEIAKIFKDSGIQAAKADTEAAAVTFSGLSPRMMAIITDAYERTVGEISTSRAQRPARPIRRLSTSATMHTGKYAPARSPTPLPCWKA